MCKITSKLFLTVLSLIFWLVAGALVFIGCWIFATYHHYNDLTKGTHILVPAIIMLAVGIFVFILGCIGCVGAFKEQKCLLGIFFTIILVIFVGIVTCAVLAYIYRDKVGDIVQKNLEHGLEHYNETQTKHEIDYVQETLQCCGVNNYTDWAHTPFYNVSMKYPYPESCCAHNNYTSKLYGDGCYHKLNQQFRSHFGIIAGVTAAFAIVQLVGMISACVLICRGKPEIPYIGLTEPAGMRV